MLYPLSYRGTITYYKAKCYHVPLGVRQPRSYVAVSANRKQGGQSAPFLSCDKVKPFRRRNKVKDRKLQPRWIALFAATVGALYLCWLMLLPFIDVLAWAAVLVIVFYPIHQRIVARTGCPGRSAVVSCLLVITTLLVPLSLVTLAVVSEMSGAAPKLQSGVEALLDPNSPVTGRVLRWLGQYVDIEQLRSQQFIVERLRGLSC